MAEKRIAVVLSGCGYLDGAEINEAVMTALALRLEGFAVDHYSLTKIPNQLTDHISLAPVPNTARLGLIDLSARISRGDIHPIDELDPTRYAGLAIPGGFGVAKHFCDFATEGSDAVVEPAVEKTVAAFLTSRTPVMAVCVAPVLVGLVAAKQGRQLEITLGDGTNEASAAMRVLGHRVHHRDASECVVDETNRVASTPAFMCDITLEQAWGGIQKAAHQLKVWSETVNGPTA